MERVCRFCTELASTTSRTLRTAAYINSRVIEKTVLTVVDFITSLPKNGENCMVRIFRDFDVER